MPLPSSLTVHHPRLDAEHGELFDLIDAALEAYRTGGTAAVRQAVAAFADAMLAHTAGEEALMEETLYPERGRHKVAHEVFLADLRQLQEELATAGATPAVEGWLRVRLPEWLRFHIAANDTRFGEHLARRASPARPTRPSGLPRRT